MAFIKYLPDADIADSDRVPDNDNIIRVHGIHSKIMRLHYEMYVEIMHRSSPLTRVQREMVAVSVSAANGCHY